MNGRSLFFVDIVPQDNNKDIYSLDGITLNQKPLGRKKYVPRKSKYCQAFGHIETYSHKESVCAKFGQEQS